MTYLHSFDNSYPPARYDGSSWTRVHVEESADGAAWTQIVDAAITPDPSPETPSPFDLSVPSSLERGWFRLQFVDAGGVLSPYTMAAYSPPEGSLTPSVDDVSLLLRTRTVGGIPQGGLGGDTGPGDLTTFTDETRPSRSEVERIIETAYSTMTSKIHHGVNAVPDESREAVRHAVALYAAVLIEVSFFKEASSDQLSLWRDLARETVEGVNEAIDADTDDGHLRPTFGSLIVGSIRVPVRDNCDPVPGIDF